MSAESLESEVTAMVEERVAKFLVSNQLLANLLHLPPGAIITSVWDDRTSPATSCFWVKVVHSDLPKADFYDPPTITPYATEHKIEWHWNVKP